MGGSVCHVARTHQKSLDGQAIAVSDSTGCLVCVNLVWRVRLTAAMRYAWLQVTESPTGLLAAANVFVENDCVGNWQFALEEKMPTTARNTTDRLSLLSHTAVDLMRIRPSGFFVMYNNISSIKRHNQNVEIWGNSAFQYKVNQAAL